MKKIISLFAVLMAFAGTLLLSSCGGQTMDVTFHSNFEHCGRNGLKDSNGDPLQDMTITITLPTFAVKSGEQTDFNAFLTALAKDKLGSVLMDDESLGENWGVIGFNNKPDGTGIIDLAVDNILDNLLEKFLYSLLEPTSFTDFYAQWGKVDYTKIGGGGDDDESADDDD